MAYTIKPLSCDPAGLIGLSEKLVLSHYENNYGGAVKRLNSISDQLAELDFASAPVFVINGLKREELIATNSMILHELYFDGLGATDMPASVVDLLTRDFGSVTRWQAEFTAMGRHRAAARAGYCSLGRSTIPSSSISGLPTIFTRLPVRRPSSHSTCTSTHTTSTTAPRLLRMWRPLCRTSIGLTRLRYMRVLLGPFPVSLTICYRDRDEMGSCSWASAIALDQGSAA